MGRHYEIPAVNKHPVTVSHGIVWALDHSELLAIFTLLILVVCTLWTMRKKGLNLGRRV